MTLRRTHCYTSVKGLHKYIDMGRLPALAALVIYGRRPWKKLSQHLNSND
nr:MAG TPA: hypothetical protein [Caudoviricetes sp.]